MSGWMFGDMRLAPWQQRLIERLLEGGEVPLLQQYHTNRADRVAADAHLIVAAVLSGRSLTLSSHDDSYAEEVVDEVRRLIGEYE